MKKFDLNIEKILEDWEIYHALREIIANALDEQSITKTKDINIFQDSSGNWHIKDYGRGIKYEHFTQKENVEKLNNPNLIGKFGIGLKDALATFDRKNIKVLILSKFGNITIGKSNKHDFEDITTLHANIAPPSSPQFIGTEFIFSGITESDIQKAKNLFLKFSGDKLLAETKYGQVLGKNNISTIYINGVKVAEEDNFLFSYNITSLDGKIRKALNRERTNVGRAAYSDRVKAILITSKNEIVARQLVDDLANYSAGTTHEELKWIDVQEHAVKILNSTSKVIFLSTEEIMTENDMIDQAKSSGYEIIAIPDNLRNKIQGIKDISGTPIRDLGQFYKEYNESFEFQFIKPDILTPKEKSNYAHTNKILSLIGGKPQNVKQIKISETMRNELGSTYETEGLWNNITGEIIIKRSQLSDLSKYAGTLIHEIAHAKSGYGDTSRAFEIELTRSLGTLAEKLLNHSSSLSKQPGFITNLFHKLISQ